MRFSRNRRNSSQNWGEPRKAAPNQTFYKCCLITPTLEVVGSNPVSRTISSVHNRFELWTLEFFFRHIRFQLMYEADMTPASFVVAVSQPRCLRNHCFRETRNDLSYFATGHFLYSAISSSEQSSISHKRFNVNVLIFSFFLRRSSWPLLNPYSFISLYCEMPFSFIIVQSRS